MISDISSLIGKTIKTIDRPKDITIRENLYQDDIIVIKFTDGTVLKLASWDYESYSSGIAEEISTVGKDDLDAIDNRYTFTIHWDGKMKTLEKIIEDGLLEASNGRYRYGNLINNKGVECKQDCPTFMKYKVCYCREVTIRPYETTEQLLLFTQEQSKQKRTI